MTPEQIAQRLQNRQHGTIFSIVSRRPCKVKQGVDFKIEKLTNQQAMLAEYGNRKPVREGVESGEREAPQLPRGVKSVKYINGIKFFENFSGKTCLACPIVGNRPQSKYLLNNKEVPFETVADYLLASEKVIPETKEQLQKIHQAPFKMIDVANIEDVR